MSVGPEELREAIAVALWRQNYLTTSRWHSASEEAQDAYRRDADAVLAVPQIADALAAVERSCHKRPAQAVLEIPEIRNALPPVDGREL